MKKLLSLLLIICSIGVAYADDKSTVTSLKYVTDELNTRQDKFGANDGKAMTFTNVAGGNAPRDVKSSLGSNTSDTGLPTVSAVNAGLDDKQNTIPAANTNTVVTYTGVAGTLGQKGIYQDTGTYASQQDNLIDAGTFNAALRNGLENEFVCADRDPVSNQCWLWTIDNTYNGVTENYVSATGTGYQNGTPTPTNPIDPVFYHQGDMILRKVGDYADSYDATTHKITRRVGVKVLDGITTGKMFSSAWNATYKRCNLTISDMLISVAATEDAICNFFPYSSSVNTSPTSLGFCTNNGYLLVSFIGMENITSANDANTWLADQYAAGTPVTVYYPLETPVEEDWPDTTYNTSVYIPQNQTSQNQ